MLCRERSEVRPAFIVHFTECVLSLIHRRKQAPGLFKRDPTLRSRLLAVTTAVAEHVLHGASLERLMGSSIDALKLVSSLTLFGHVARTLHDVEGLPAYDAIARVAGQVLDAAAVQGYGRCQYTLDRLKQ